MMILLFLYSRFLVSLLFLLSDFLGGVSEKRLSQKKFLFPSLNHSVVHIVPCYMHFLVTHYKSRINVGWLLESLAVLFQKHFSGKSLALLHP